MCGSDANEKLLLLDAAKSRAISCRKCKLRETRTNVVFGFGNPLAEVVLVGEAPGRSEDASGLPFVGAAGKNLDRLLKAASLKRDDVYITNAVLCRPPGNRRPTDAEIEACRGFLEETLRIIDPKIVMALGKTAAETLLGRRVNVRSEHGSVFDVPGKKFRVVVTYHPAASIYRRELWNEMSSDFRKAAALVRASGKR